VSGAPAGGPLTPAALLADFSPAVRALAERVVALVMAHVPDVEVRAYPGWRGIGLRDAQSGYFCGVFPRRENRGVVPGEARQECVRVLFEHGAALPDPEGVLTDGGEQTRWATLRPGQPVPEGALLRLVDAALLHGATRAARRGRA
jgi:hypothetical protein